MPSSSCEMPCGEVGAEPAEAEDRAEGRRRDDLDGRRPDARDDHGERERDLDRRSTWRPGQAHAPGRLGELRVDLRDPRVGVDQDRRDPEDDHRDQRRQHLEPELRVEQDVNGTAIPISASDGIARPRLAALIAMPIAPPRVPDPQADRDRDEAGDQEAGQRQRDVLEHAHRDPVRPGPVRRVRQPGDGLGDDGHAASPAGPQRLDVRGVRPGRRATLDGDQRAGRSRRRAASTARRRTASRSGRSGASPRR